MSDQRIYQGERVTVERNSMNLFEQFELTQSIYPYEMDWNPVNLFKQSVLDQMSEHEKYIYQNHNAFAESEKSIYQYYLYDFAIKIRKIRGTGFMHGTKECKQITYDKEIKPFYTYEQMKEKKAKIQQNLSDLLDEI